MKVNKIQSTDDIDRLFASKEALFILKHSPRCFYCDEAFKALESTQNCPAFYIDVLSHREVSNYLAEKTGIAHESPQIFLIKEGQVIWHEGQTNITKSALEQAFKNTIHGGS